MSARETLEDFMRRKHDPKWKPAPLPRSGRRRLSEAAFEKLMTEQGARRLS